jgi:hypothetical protein
VERCGFFDANLVGEEYDRVYLASQFAAYFASFIGNGIYASKSDKLQVVEQDLQGMAVNVLGGQGWINGYWYENTESISLAIDVADGVLNRVDSVVLRLGFSERNMWVAVKKGTPATSPSAPALTRNADYYELQLATIDVPASSIKITQAQITDTRMNQNVCGWVTGVVDQLDTTTLFNQFEAYFNEFKENNQADYESWTEAQKQAWLSWVSGQEADFTDWTDEQKAEYDEWYDTHINQWQTEFDTWFQNIKDQLGEDVAGNLQNQIDEHEARLNNLEMMLLATGMLFAANEISTGECLTTNDDYVLLFEWPICQC